MGTVEGKVAHAVGVEITAGLTDDGQIAEMRLKHGDTYLVASGVALGASACGEASARAWMGSDSGGDRVGLPDIHLSAAGSDRTGARVG